MTNTHQNFKKVNHWPENFDFSNLHCSLFPTFDWKNGENKQSLTQASKVFSCAMTFCMLLWFSWCLGFGYNFNCSTWQYKKKNVNFQATRILFLFFVENVLVKVGWCHLKHWRYKFFISFLGSIIFPQYSSLLREKVPANFWIRF